MFSIFVAINLVKITFVIKLINKYINKDNVKIRHLGLQRGGRKLKHMVTTIK